PILQHHTRIQCFRKHLIYPQSSPPNRNRNTRRKLLPKIRSPCRLLLPPSQSQTLQPTPTNPSNPRSLSQPQLSVNSSPASLVTAATHSLIAVHGSSSSTGLPSPDPIHFPKPPLEFERISTTSASNYLILLALVLAFSLLSHPVSLFLLVSLIAAWIQLYVLRPSDQPLVIFGRTITNFETLIGLTLITVVVVLLTSVISLLLSAVTMWLGTVSAHGAFRVPEDLFLDEQEPLASGLFSFVGGPTSSAGVPTGSSLV
ncbi:PRA1 family protein, partial [Quillaja saponaria]